MANFPTHIATSALIGAAYGAAGHVGYDVPVPACILAGGLFTIAGVLPDVDSDHAVILRECLTLAAVVTPMMMLDRFRELGWTHETIVLTVSLIYLLIRFGLGEILRRYTIHRGMWHSIPAACIAGLVVYYLCDCPDQRLRLFKSGAMVLGYVWHLILDEIYSFRPERGRLRIRRSFGTAFKLWGTQPIANFMTYSLLGIAIAGTAVVEPPAHSAEGQPYVEVPYDAPPAGQPEQPVYLPPVADPYAPPGYSLTPVPD